MPAPEIAHAPPAPRTEADALGRRFAGALPSLGDRPLILGHFDADGLSAAAILHRSLEQAGLRPAVRIVGKGENPWLPEMRRELEALQPPGLILADLGVREGDVLPGTPAILIDHHVPTGTPGEAMLIGGHGLDPEPTTSLLAFWCAQGLGDAGHLLWLAALGLIGDMAEDKGFAELAGAQRLYGKTALRKAVSLINAPRRAARADASPALSLLLKCNSPHELLSGEHAETAQLVAAREEVRAALDAARRIAPKVRGEVALITFSSPCQIHPLIAQQWRGRLARNVVIAANTGYRPGWVHFAARSACARDLIAFLAERRPPDAGSEYGSGHRQATGGALRLADWNAFVATLGFPEEQIA